MSPLLRLYLAFSAVSDPLWRAVHRRRLKRGKEIAVRLPEKYGRYIKPRHNGPLLWFHALSVGESFALLPLIEVALERRRDAHVVLTTSTASSVEALAKANLPDRCAHILLPIDTRTATRAFLDHWSPDVACFAELDFWPRLMVETHRRGIPLILLNSRMPEHNFLRRKRLGSMMRDVLRLFDPLLVQDVESKKRLAALGADDSRIEVVGALKAAARPLPADAADLATMEQLIGARPVWLAAATAGSEHSAMIAAHLRVSAAAPDTLLIVAPRFKADADTLEKMARDAFTEVARRSRSEAIAPNTQVYIADTYGEMGLWYRLAPISFIGHSLGAHLEGKNPFEAAALGSAILSGPDTSYFSESYASLTTEGAVRLVTDADSLAEALLTLQDDAAREAMCAGATRVIDTERHVLTRTWAAIEAALADAKDRR